MIHEWQSNDTGTCRLFIGLGCTVHSVKSVRGTVETLVLPGFCAEFCQCNCVTL